MDARIGSEDLHWGIFQVLAANVNTVIATEETRGYVIDDAFETMTGRGLGRVSLERVDVAKNIHMGHRPSLIDAPADEYPSIAVMTYLSNQSPRNLGLDHAREAALTVSIECLVKAGPYDDDDRGISDGEEIVNRRVQRTAEAIQQVMLAKRELSGYELPDSTEPIISWGEVFAKADLSDDSAGPRRFYWQGVRLQYVYLKMKSLYGAGVPSL